MEVIVSKIVGFKIVEKTESKPIEEVKPVVPTKPVIKNRPDVLDGNTYKLKPPDLENAIYVTINDIIDENGKRKPFEMFINSKNMEHFQWIVGMTRLISAIFRTSQDLSFLVEELKNVFDPKGGFFQKGGGYCPSLVAAIGGIIETHLKEIGVIEVEELSDAHKELISSKLIEYKEKNKDEVIDENGFPKSSQMCSKCNTKAVIVMDGCLTCLNCGDSKCG